MTIPVKDKNVNMPHFQSYDKNIIHQTDLLFLLDDDDFRYALVVVDVRTRTIDARSLKSKTAETVLKEFKDIYKDKILEMSKRIEVDSGTKFKGIVKDYFKKHKVDVKVGLSDRHRQQAIVEKKNLTIEKAIHKR